MLGWAQDSVVGQEAAGQLGTREGRLEVQPADRAIQIKQLTEDLQALNAVDAHRTWIDLAQVEAACGDLGHVPTTRTMDWNRRNRLA